MNDLSVIDAYVTYTILIPATLFVESLLGPGRHGLLRRTWQVVAVCGAGAILIDLIARRLLLYTDGLTEAGRSKGDEFFGDAELARVLTSTPASDDLMAGVLHAHRHWIGEGAPLSDDVSVVVIARVEQALPGSDLINGMS